ncbi:MAG: hypothetical protein GVY14_03210 [Spirochaetes bacterium]|jgi:two-component sensor histidine kinase|nr:hypothetical protein [Spirochaetota bacterium]
MVLAALAALAALYALNLTHFLLFHFTVELFSIAVAFSVFGLTWAARDRLEDGGLLLIGVSYLFVGGVDLLHTLSYKGTGLFPGYGADLPTQLWLIARGLETVSLLLGLRYLERRIPYRSAALVYGVVTIGLVLTAVPLRVFPTAYVTGEGLTPFKIVTEYTLSAALIVAGFGLYRKRANLDAVMFRWLLAAIATTALAEVLFTFYIDVYGISNALGHILKIISFYAVYQAIVERGIRRPDKLFYRQLSGREQKLAAALAEQDTLMREIQHRTKNDMTLIQSFLSLQAGETEDPHAKNILEEAGNRVSVLARIYENIYQTQEVESVHLGPLVQRTISDLQASTAQPSVRFDLSLADVSVPTKVSVAIALIINELVTNALKYAFEDTDDPCIQIRATGAAGHGGVERAGDSVEVVVEDNGAGLPQAVVDGESGGYGTRLVQALAWQHNGTVSFENHKGAVVRVRLSIGDERRR